MNHAHTSRVCLVVAAIFTLTAACGGQLGADDLLSGGPNAATAVDGTEPEDDDLGYDEDEEYDEDEYDDEYDGEYDGEYDDGEYDDGKCVSERDDSERDRWIDRFRDRLGRRHRDERGADWRRR